MPKAFIRRLITPAAFLFGAIVLTQLIAADPGSLEVGGGRLGPGAWPEAMLIGVMICAALWMARELTPLLKRAFSHQGAPPPEPEEDYDRVRALTGLAAVMVYGLAIPYLGFMIATLIFLAGWMWLGGMRGKLSIPLISVLGTIALLYVFAFLARMPLDRGAGFMDDVTVAVFRLLRIF